MLPSRKDEHPHLEGFFDIHFDQRCNPNINMENICLFSSSLRTWFHEPHLKQQQQKLHSNFLKFAARCLESSSAHCSKCIYIELSRFAVCYKIFLVVTCKIYLGTNLIFPLKFIKVWLKPHALSIDWHRGKTWILQSLW